MVNVSQKIHGSRRDIDREYKQVVQYSHRTVYTGIKIDNQRRRGIQKKKLSDFDTLWLLQKIKKTTVGVDKRANPYLTLHEKMIIFLEKIKVRQNRMMTI